MDNYLEIKFVVSICEGEYLDELEKANELDTREPITTTFCSNKIKNSN